MARPRRVLLAVLSAVLCYIVFHLYGISIDVSVHPPGSIPSSLSAGTPPSTLKYTERPKFTPIIRPRGHNFTRTLVMAVTPPDDGKWVDDLPDQSFERQIYQPLSPNPQWKVPRNKGHEAMVYLTYLIDNYHNLSDITIFMHGHRFTWHNNPVGGMDSAQMLAMLSSERVNREGYMNMNCQWQPGCKPGFFPKDDERNLREEPKKKEKLYVAKSWPEIFPGIPTADLIRTPCCAQFAVSREIIHATPLTSFVYWRDWLLRTPLKDEISGRVFEQYWHIIFTGLHELCPEMVGCYCDGYGICFRDDDQFEEWFKYRNGQKFAQSDMNAWKAKDKAIKDATAGGDMEKVARLEVPEPAEKAFIQKKIDSFGEKMNKIWDESVWRGKDPINRAESVGRKYHDGDGF